MKSNWGLHRRICAQGTVFYLLCHSRSALYLTLALAGVVLLCTMTACDRRSPGTAAALENPVIIAEGILRVDLRFACGDSTCAAWLYLPVNIPSPPVVIMGHGFAGTRDVALPYFAERFARAGLAAFVFDYRYFGASGGSPRQLVDPWSQLEDWRAALAHVRTLATVDHARLSLWGSSLGGGHALIIAAEEQNLCAVVAQAPLIDTTVEGEATFPGVLWAMRLLLTGWGDLLWERVGGEAITIPAIAPHGSFGMIVDDVAYAAFAKLVIPGATYRNAVVARSPFTFDDYNPALHVKNIQAPVLLLASRTDRFASFAAIEAAARVNPKLRIVTFAGDHFDVYSSPGREVVADATVTFLSTHSLKP